MKPFKVLLTSTSYPSDLEDWRGRFIADMVAGLASIQGLALETWMPPGLLPTEVHDFATVEEAQWLQLLTSQGGIAHVLRTRGPIAAWTIYGLLRRLRQAFRRSEADVLHINWLQNAIPMLGIRKPALITVLGSDLGLLKLPGLAMFMRLLLRRHPVILAPNAGWMVPKLREVFGDEVLIKPICFGVDKSWYEVQRKRSQEGPLRWLAITRLTRAKLGHLFTWGEGIFQGTNELHLFGPHQEEDILIPDWVHYHGATHPEALREIWFPQAAGLISLSQHSEGRPQVMLEAMAAGLPVIASDLPAHREIIFNGRNGTVVDSPESLAVAVSTLADFSANFAMGEEGRAWMQEHIGSWDDTARRYHQAYQQLMRMSK